MALLLPDSCDKYCPVAFKKDAREILLGMSGRPSGWGTEIESDMGLPQSILKFIGGLANWDNAADCSYLETGRALVRSAHLEEPPLVVDPVSGGGSIPLEALRPAYAPESVKARPIRICNELAEFTAVGRLAARL
jgi:hypothetical protein